MAKGGAVALPSWKALLHCSARLAADTGAARSAGTVVMLKLAMYAALSLLVHHCWFS